MKVCVFGAGAIGGYLAAKLAAAGKVELTLVARGPHLAAIRANGLTLIEGGATNTYASRQRRTRRRSARRTRSS